MQINILVPVIDTDIADVKSGFLDDSIVAIQSHEKSHKSFFNETVLYKFDFADPVALLDESLRIESDL